MLLSRFPYPLEKGDKLRAFHHLKEFSRFYDVYLICISAHQPANEATQIVEQFCKSFQVHILPKWRSLLSCLGALLDGRPFQTHYFSTFKIKSDIRREIKEIQPDHLFCQLIRVADIVKDYHACPKTLDYMDAFSMGIQRRVNLEPWYKRALFKSESKRLMQFETQMFDYFEHKLIISEQDKSYIRHPERKNIHIIPNGIGTSFFQPLDNVVPQFDLVFVGNLSYPPNIEAIALLTEKILPILQGSHPKASILIAGAQPTNQVKSMCTNHPNIELWEGVDDIRKAYQSGRVFVAPMTIGTGLQNKLLEAMALGLPCVTTTLANNALKAEPNKQILIGETPNQLAEQISKALHAPDIVNIARAGQDFVRVHYKWDESVEKLVKIMNPEPSNL